MILIALVLSSCSQKQENSISEMLKDPSQQEKVLALMTEDHDLGKKYIGKMMNNDHATGMMVDELVRAAANDTILAGKLSTMITKYPELMVLTNHHFMPIIASDEHLSDTFCDHALEHDNIAKSMCQKMNDKEGMEPCH
ncbi:hypothetical protein [Flaviramulus basaltis]|uniref:hypothetical protein n=1 Tax=Flaviramulus basaltis TaxID=369401 RepID=UPI0011608F15|nr:hypothetical protein [Flaviramulus basaltis]